ncbi:MAG: hypothetical protein GY927_15680 [bacterium]|nr:hypothetical protein [bacterium]
MKVLCIQNTVDDDLAKKVGLLEGEPRLYRSITPGNEYIVLGISYDPSSTCYAGKPMVEVKNDDGGLSSIPLFLFDVIDGVASKHWQCRFSVNGVLTFLPESFYTKYYHDDLSEGMPEVVDNFKEVCRVFENE